jgi:CheY-like chemotaxis protein
MEFDPSNISILIADDELHGRELLGALLEPHGYQLLFAEDGVKALAQARRHVPDLVLLDVMMPGKDGFEVCQELRSDSELAEVPIMLLTALEDRDSRLRGIESGADDFITKPYDRR